MTQQALGRYIGGGAIRNGQWTLRPRTEGGADAICSVCGYHEASYPPEYPWFYPYPKYDHCPAVQEEARP